MTFGRTSTLLVATALAALSVCAGAAQAAFPGVNGRIVFSSDRDGETDVYAMSADGSNQTRLTVAAGVDDYPMWSPAGTRVVFSSWREGVSKVFAMNADGSGQVRVTNPLTTVGGQGDEEPSLSRNGARIAFRSDRELGFAHIWAVNADGSNPVRLTSVGDNLNPVWSPTSDRIAFTSDRDGGGDWELFAMDGFGGNVVQLTTNSYLDSNPDWSPDGTKIAFQSFDDGADFDIWVLDLARGALTQLTTDPAFDTAPAWSPDGTKLVFQSNRDGDWEIFTMNADGSSVQQLTHNDAADRVADWQPLGGGGPQRDTTPPTMVLPGPLPLDATSPAGARVVFHVGVSDAVDPSPTLTCSPASGATFPIGSTTVTCTASDASGNTATGRFVVTVVGAGAQIQRLLNEVIAASGLTPTQKAYLRMILERLLVGFDANNQTHRWAACRTLATFSNLVSAWNGHPIPPALADKWHADAHRIREVLNC
jgi:Tol biopolymer transport system component